MPEIAKRLGKFPATVGNAVRVLRDREPVKGVGERKVRTRWGPRFVPTWAAATYGRRRARWKMPLFCPRSSRSASSGVTSRVTEGRPLNR